MALDPGDTLSSCSSVPPPYYANPEHPEDYNRIAEDYKRIAEESTKTLDEPSPGKGKEVPFIDDDGLPEVVVASSSEAHDEPTQETFTPPVGSSLVETVTPLHLLGDQSDTVDCPFCRRRVETRVKKSSSVATHVAATALFLTTGVGVVAPYMRRWKGHVTHYCMNCDRKVAHRRYNEQGMQALGTPDHLREASRFPEAEAPKQEKQKKR
ncbi:uncharacterized protein TRIVIDRAFT_219361 [Trichoderma virens Gv29-8]|uniref:LITAF domain-containing protein n=1 Tax=Hypocrea virens (strain Gv29-8 / FGSC 10586) TaxID=413071 RepID=G9MJD3_HYPVG|nr:uncharacterized protein TRIVIDRAFT_219361 [Trichoderma virens Gv29-8]EHK25596.1 hypothetical protein TRIVIDRAFT_219361 [Trichoderma virens Gv29-8]UKZ48584.1 hypothetical protein TrVGV298_002809 [Trichoderma virens]